MTRSSVVACWGSSPEERSRPFPCDGMIDQPDRILYRAVDIAAPSDVAFRWVCQLRTAPYSYDWIDNFGRRSPRTLTPGLDRLEIGQTVMTIFRVVEFAAGCSMTVEATSRLFGRVVASYVVIPVSGRASRLVVKLAFKAPGGVLGVAMRLVLPAGDLIMMRKQLLTLKALAQERHPAPCV